MLEFLFILYDALAKVNGEVYEHTRMWGNLEMRLSM